MSRALNAVLPTKGYASLDPDTSMSPGTLDAAYLATGGALAAIDAIMNGDIDQAFCAVRPPGHHAEADRAMGFCFFNSVAIAARYIQQQYGLQRVLIVDWDVHHGNGTQHAFYDDASVLFFSTHQFPYYPGTGGAMETGEGRGKGLTINVPLSGGQGDDEYREVFQKVLIPAADTFQPEFVLINFFMTLPTFFGFQTLQPDRNLLIGNGMSIILNNVPYKKYRSDQQDLMLIEMIPISRVWT